MTQLMENPLLIIGMGAMLLIMLGNGLVKTGRKELVYAMVATGVIFVGLLIAERLVETDNEQIRSTLKQIAHDVEHNDIDAVLGHIHPKSKNSALARARNEMPHYSFHEVRITTVKDIAEISLRPKTYNAKFMVRVNVDVGNARSLQGARYVSLELRQHDGQWKVWDYNHWPPQQGFRDPY